MMRSWRATIYFAQQTPIADAIRSSGGDFRDAITRWLARREIRQ
jgi:hypothetical protein